jgi:hypothetical protein
MQYMSRFFQTLLADSATQYLSLRDRFFNTIVERIFVEYLHKPTDSFLTWVVVFVLPSVVIGLLSGAVYEGLFAGFILACIAQFLVNRPF